MAVTFLQKSSGNSATTTLSSAVSDSDTSFPLTSDTAFLTGGGLVIIDEGETTEELAYYTGKSGGALTIPLANRGLEGGSAQGHSSGASVKGVLSADMWNNLIETVLNGFSATDGSLDASKVLPASYLDTDGTLAANSDTKIASQKAVKTYVDNNAGDVTSDSTTTFTNKTIDADGTGNSITNLEAENLKNRTRYIPLGAGDFYAGTATTAGLGSANGGNTSAWLFDAAQTEDVYATFVVPADFVAGTMTAEWFWSMESATSGDVVLQLQVGTITDGVQITSSTDLLTQSQTVAVPGAADTVEVTSWNTFTPTAGAMVRFRVLRLGADGSDNATGDLVFYGAKISYTADM